MPSRQSKKKRVPTEKYINNRKNVNRERRRHLKRIEQK